MGLADEPRGADIRAAEAPLLRAHARAIIDSSMRRAHRRLRRGMGRDALRPSGRRIGADRIYFFATLAQIGTAAVVWRMAGLTARNDLVFGLFFDGTGPMAGPSPHDPALGSREAVRVVSPPVRRANVILFVVDSLRARSMSAYGNHRATTPFLDSLLAEGARAVVGVFVASRPPLGVSPAAHSEHEASCRAPVVRAQLIQVTTHCL
jgi:hypothetical protein